MYTCAPSPSQQQQHPHPSPPMEWMMSCGKRAGGGFLLHSLPIPPLPNEARPRYSNMLQVWRMAAIPPHNNGTVGCVLVFPGAVAFLFWFSQGQYIVVYGFPIGFFRGNTLLCIGFPRGSWCKLVGCMPYVCCSVLLCAAMCCCVLCMHVRMHVHVRSSHTLRQTYISKVANAARLAKTETDVQELIRIASGQPRGTG